MSMKGKEALVKKSVFFKLLTNKNNILIVISEFAHKKLIGKIIEKPLIIESIL